MAAENDASKTTESNTRPRDESSSPGKDRKQARTDIETTESFDSLKEMLREQHKEVIAKFDGMKSQVTQFRQTVDQERTARIRDVSEIKARLDKVEIREKDDFDTIIEAKVDQAMKK